MMHDQTDITLFKEALERLKSVRIDIHNCLTVFQKAIPGVARDDNLYGRFSNCLAHLEADGFLTFPKGKKTELLGGRLFHPRLTLQRQPSVPVGNTVIEWDARLSPLTKGKTDKALADLQRIDEYLKRTMATEAPVVPLNARSLTIFGDEKLLDRRYIDPSYTTFCGGALTLADLHCYVPLDEFLAYEVADACPSNEMLLIENKETYHVFKHWNRKHLRFRVVAFGSGATILASALALPNLVRNMGIQTIRYFGDIDEAGMSIPLQVIEKVRKTGDEISIRPAIDFYRKCIEKGQQYPWKKVDPNVSIERWKKLTGPAVRLWFNDEQLYLEVDAIISSGERIAQEWLYDPS
jgi:hypothetical protein